MQRPLAFLILQTVLEKHHSLDQAFARHLQADTPGAAWVKSLCFGILRQRSALDFILTKLSKKPLKKKDLSIKLILYIGMYQLLFMETKPHAAIFETVELTKQTHLQHARGFVNAVLQNLLRSGSPTLPAEIIYNNYPEWLLKNLKTAYPQQWQSICAASLEHPPLFLRVNPRKISREDYVKFLGDHRINPLSAVGIELAHPTDIKNIPYFEEGYVSVQDLAAQQAAFLLDLTTGQVVLDACAAPGGKACHILETADVTLYALDQDAQRLERVSQNLVRLGLTAKIQQADAATVHFPEQFFDRILLDAPCSGTGVIRRHPDILVLRRESDIPKLTAMQLKLLHHLWPMLKPGGILLYATCSVLLEENAAIITKFLEQTTDAYLKTQLQFLPETQGPDGFYYAKLVRR